MAFEEADRDVPTLHSLVALFFSLRMPSPHEPLDAAFSLKARMFLCHMRYALMTLISKHEHMDSSLGIYPLPSGKFFSDDVGEHAYMHPFGKLSGVLKDNYKTLAQPRSLLSLLNSWQYNPLDAIMPRECRDE